MWTRKQWQVMCWRVLKGFYNDVLIFKNDESTREKLIVEIDKLDNNDLSQHVENMDFELMECPHCCALRQEQMVPKCMMTLHVYVCQTVNMDKTMSRDK